MKRLDRRWAAGFLAVASCFPFGTAAAQGRVVFGQVHAQAGAVPVAPVVPPATIGAGGYVLGTPPSVVPPLIFAQRAPTLVAEDVHLDIRSAGQKDGSSPLIGRAPVQHAQTDTVAPGVDARADFGVVAPSPSRRPRSSESPERWRKHKAWLGALVLATILTHSLRAEGLGPDGASYMEIPTPAAELHPDEETREREERVRRRIDQTGQAHLSP